MKFTKKQALIAAVPFVLMLLFSGPFVAEYLVYGDYVEGVSMYPLWRKGKTTVFIDYGIPERNLTGEIVSYKDYDRNGEYYRNIVHVVVEDRKETLVTQGLNPETNKVTDNPFSRTDVNGVVYKWCEMEVTYLHFVFFIVGASGIFCLVAEEWLNE